MTAIDAVTGESTAGAKLDGGSGAWSALSNRDAKRNISPVDPVDILQRLRKIPIAKWSYKTQDPSIRHMGPMAQDFYAAFNVGEDKKFIATIDADGVALAAIQGLYDVVKEKEARIADLEARVAALEDTVGKQGSLTRAGVLGMATPGLALAGLIGLMVLGRSRKGGA